MAGKGRQIFVSFSPLCQFLPSDDSNDVFISCVRPELKAIFSLDEAFPFSTHTSCAISCRLQLTCFSVPTTAILSPFCQHFYNLNVFSHSLSLDLFLSFCLYLSLYLYIYLSGRERDHSWPFYVPEIVFIGNYVKLSGTAECMTEKIKDVLSGHGVAIAEVDVLGRDGASVMVGRKAGVAQTSLPRKHSLHTIPPFEHTD